MPVSSGPDPDDPGFDDDELEDLPGRDRNSGGPILPSYIPTNFAFWAKVKGFFESPTTTIKNVVLGMLIGGIAAFLKEILDAIELILAGTQPNVYAAPNEQYGLVDYPVVIADVLGGAAGSTVRSLLRSLTGIIGSFTFAQGSPVNGLIVNAVVVVMAILVVRYGPVVLRAGLEAIPVIGGPLATLLGGSD